MAGVRTYLYVDRSSSIGLVRIASEHADCERTETFLVAGTASATISENLTV